MTFFDIRSQNKIYDEKRLLLEEWFSDIHGLCHCVDCSGVNVCYSHGAYSDRVQTLRVIMEQYIISTTPSGDKNSCTFSVMSTC
jgi:hypothetical protein